jgi:hypothetical protein
MYGTIAQDGSRAGSAASQGSSALKNALARHLSPDWQRCPPHACHGSSWAWRRPRQWRWWACWLSPVVAAGCAASATPPPCPLSGRKAAAVVGAAGPAATQGRQRAVPGARRGRRPPILLLPLPVPALGTSRHPPGRRAAIWSAKSALIKVREAAGAGPVPTASGCCCCFSPIQRQLAAGRRAGRQEGTQQDRYFAPLQAPWSCMMSGTSLGQTARAWSCRNSRQRAATANSSTPSVTGCALAGLCAPLCPSVPLCAPQPHMRTLFWRLLRFRRHLHASSAGAHECMHSCYQLSCQCHAC